jgi:hypothetical protein
MTEWKWFVIVGPIVLIAAVAFAISRGISIGGLALGILLTLGYVTLAGWPTWGAGILRGGEERDARKQATLDIQETDKPTPPPY